jgi:FKBP-type peptidyl-prolyl cis-trans isomerase
MAARRRDRITALFFAILFIGSSSILTVAIVIDNLTNKDDAPVAEQQATATQTGENMLKGTQLEGFTPVENVTELQKIDLVEGTGPEVQTGATVTVDYTGAVAATGKIFESSKDSGQPVSFGLDQVIKGWTDGVPGMKVGGTRRLVIPAAQAYGEASPSPDIPANADLVFDITLQAIGE